MYCSFLYKYSISDLNEYVQSFISEASTPMLVLVGAVLSGMMSADMGGPLNKTAYAIGVLLLADCLPETGPGTLIMASIMAGGMGTSSSCRRFINTSTTSIFG